MLNTLFGSIKGYFLSNYTWIIYLFISSVSFIGGYQIGSKYTEYVMQGKYDTLDNSYSELRLMFSNFKLEVSKETINNQIENQGFVDAAVNRIREGELNDIKNQNIIAELTRINKLQMHKSICGSFIDSGKEPSNSQTVTNTDEVNRILSEKIDSTVAEIRSDDTESALICEQLNAAAIKTNIANGYKYNTNDELIQ